MSVHGKRAGKRADVGYSWFRLWGGRIFLQRWTRFSKWARHMREQFQIHRKWRGWEATCCFFRGLVLPLAVSVEHNKMWYYYPLLWVFCVFSRTTLRPPLFDLLCVDKSSTFWNQNGVVKHITAHIQNHSMVQLKITPLQLRTYDSGYSAEILFSKLWVDVWSF